MCSLKYSLKRSDPSRRVRCSRSRYNKRLPPSVSAPTTCTKVLFWSMNAGYVLSNWIVPLYFGLLSIAFLSRSSVRRKKSKRSGFMVDRKSRLDTSPTLMAFKSSFCNALKPCLLSKGKDPESRCGLSPMIKTFSGAPLIKPSRVLLFSSKHRGRWVAKITLLGFHCFRILILCSSQGDGGSGVEPQPPKRSPQECLASHRKETSYSFAKEAIVRI
mmetsp:Transcript_12492/g.34800  ORF Transcript_12492/g.34800 Transcript_12492/m.34800 type:complete len:216 (+) Transcript_12492:123-770(+)